MALKKVELHIPEELLETLGSKKEVETKALQALFLTLIQEGEITIRYAADVLGVSYRQMLTLMAEHNVPLLNCDPSELDEELALLRQYPKK